jgi:hypothetical protein
VTHPHTLENYQNEFEWKVLEDCGMTAIGHGIPPHVVCMCMYREAPSVSATLGTIGASNDVRSMRVLARQSHELRFMKLIYDNQRQVEESLAGLAVPMLHSPTRAT